MANSSKVLLPLVLAASLVACSSDDDTPEPAAEGGPAQTSSTPKTSDDFTQQGMIVTARCSPGSSGGGLVAVDGWKPDSLEKMAHAEFQLPETVLTQTDGARPGTALDDLCAPTSSTDSSDLLAIRSLFDRDFTKLAVVIQDPQSKATHVGYVDRSGKLTDLTGEEDFGNTPHEDNAAMAPDGKTVWFTSEVDDQDRIASRALTGDHKIADEQPVETVGESHLFVLGDPGTAVLGTSARLSPNGKHLLAEDKLLELPTDRRIVGPDMIDKATALSCGGSGSTSAIGWVDDDTVLCTGPDQRFSTLDIAPNAKPSAAILPSNDHNNFVLDISPDGQRFAFLSVKEDARDFFISDLEPGSTPTKAEPPADFSSMLGALIVLDWR